MAGAGAGVNVGERRRRRDRPTIDDRRAKLDERAEWPGAPWSGPCVRPIIAPVRAFNSGAAAGDARAARQGVRFAVSGVVVALFYVGTTTALADGLNVPFQVALAVGFSAALALHFALQRLFVWRQAGPFTLALRRQLSRYLGVAALQYAGTAAITATLPSALDLPVTGVYIVTVAVASTVTFFVLRSAVFSATASADRATDAC